MGAALVAYVDRQRGSIELDPAVRPGANFTSGLEAVLLHVSGSGYCREAAHHFAKQLRDAAWQVTVRLVDELLPIRSTGSDGQPVYAVDDGADLLEDDAVVPTYEAIGPVTRR